MNSFYLLHSNFLSNNLKIDDKKVFDKFIIIFVNINCKYLWKVNIMSTRDFGLALQLIYLKNF